MMKPWQLVVNRKYLPELQAYTKGGVWNEGKGRSKGGYCLHAYLSFDKTRH